MNYNKITSTLTSNVLAVYLITDFAMGINDYVWKNIVGTEYNVPLLFAKITAILVACLLVEEVRKKMLDKVETIMYNMIVRHI